MGSEKSEQGIVVNKPIGKATKVGDMPSDWYGLGYPKSNPRMRSPSVHVRKTRALTTLHVLSRSRGGR